MGVNIDEARRDNGASGVKCALGSFGDLAECHNLSALDADVTGLWRRSTAINDCTASDYQIEHGAGP
jgi:hypothetical protein